MAGDEDDDDWTYKIVPKSWMLGEVECHYPKDNMTLCALEKMVEKAGKPLPRRSYKKVQVKRVHDDGTFSTENMILTFYVQVLETVMRYRFRQLLEPDGLAITIPKGT